MANQLNSGHVKNITAFSDLLTFCADNGADYQPTREAFKLDHLRTVLQAAEAAVGDCKTKEILYDNAIDARIIAFKDMKPLATKVVSALKASGVSAKIVDAARTINNKLQGKRATPARTPAEEASESRTVSSSKQGFDERMAEFFGLIELVRSQPEYKPNEPGLKPEELLTYLEGLKVANDAPRVPYSVWNTSRTLRDKLLYAPDTGLVDLALGVKDYLKSVYGASSNEFLRVKKLQFKRLS
ncbi:hypothetical protein GVN16_04400 [Emticicia sp. CRIBPO]|uniref:hypothetical protein n=1 Tax=Emticicia sp. CRIBPO TaxID=2683258 RepID=UPI001413010B|nr:hypothetical protein [Emticicia sp. CRIBPO]NBA84985.1 hypothetical protein [Emticicia sp. CRIBPO]